MAKFPEYRELANFEFAESPVNEQQIRTLHEGGFTEEKRNIVLVGGPGTGKSHLGLAIAIQAVKANQRVRFFSVVDLVNRLEQEKAAGKQGRLAQRLTLMDAVVLDELGYLPVSANGGALLFHLISKLYEKTSLIITTNLSFSEWVVGIWRCQDDHRTARPRHPPLRHHRDRQRQLSTEEAQPARASQPQIQGENPHTQPLKPPSGPAQFYVITAALVSMIIDKTKGASPSVPL